MSGKDKDKDKAEKQSTTERLVKGKRVFFLTVGHVKTLLAYKKKTG